MKNYAYMIFDHFITPEISSVHTEMTTSHSVTHPQSALGLARLTSEFHLHELRYTCYTLLILCKIAWYHQGSYTPSSHHWILYREHGIFYWDHKI
jgi:hypothetical protein